MRPIHTTLPLLPLALAACVGTEALGPGSGVPVEPEVLTIRAVEVGAERVVIRMTDGARCVGARPEGETGGWSGVAAECPYPLPYTVAFRVGGSPQRFLIEDPTNLPITPEGRPGPRAEVFVTDVDGIRKLYISPLGPNVRMELPGA
jgi:hypothetical protein